MMDLPCYLHGKPECRPCWAEIHRTNECYPHGRKACARCHPEYFGDQTPEKRLERIKGWFERDRVAMDRTRYCHNCVLVVCIVLAIILALRPARASERHSTC